MKRPTLTVSTQLYTDNTARNWLTVHSCQMSPTVIGGLEIVFSSEQSKLEFCLRFAQYVCTQSTI